MAVYGMWDTADSPATSAAIRKMKSSVNDNSDDTDKGNCFDESFQNDTFRGENLDVLDTTSDAPTRYQRRPCPPSGTTLVSMDLVAGHSLVHLVGLSLPPQPVANSVFYVTRARKEASWDKWLRSKVAATLHAVANASASFAGFEWCVVMDDDTFLSTHRLARSNYFVRRLCTTVLLFNTQCHLSGCSLILTRVSPSPSGASSLALLGEAPRCSSVEGPASSSAQPPSEEWALVVARSGYTFTS